MEEATPTNSYDTSTPESRLRDRGRVSPYPERRRTPVRPLLCTPPLAAHRSVGSDRTPPQQQLQEHSQPPTNSVRSLPTRTPATDAPRQRVREQQLRILVSPIVKRTVSQRDNTGNAQEDFVASGATFQDIVQRLWGEFSKHIKGIAKKIDGVWSVRPATVEDWAKVVSFKSKKAPPTSRAEEAWNAWLVKVRNETITLLIYQYGHAVSTNQDYDHFIAACVRPEHADRAGASAERTVADIIQLLQEHWRGQLQGPAVAWRLWASHITGTHDRMNWTTALDEIPPDRVLRLFSASESRLQSRSSEQRSDVTMARDMVDASLADIQVLKKDAEINMRRLNDIERGLHARRRIIDGMILNLRPPAPGDLPDPLDRIENMEDVDHQ